MLALIRPHSWNWLLTFHLIGAFTLVGAVLVVAILSVAAIRQTARERVILLRSLALRTNLALVLPAFVAVHIFGMILGDREYPKGSKSPGWLDAAFGLTDALGVFGVIVLSLLQWWVLRRARGGALSGWQAQTASYLSPVILAGFLVVLFLMTGKPGS